MDWQRFQFDYRLQSEALFSCLIQIEAYKEAPLRRICRGSWRSSRDS